MTIWLNNIDKKNGWFEILEFAH